MNNFADLIAKYEAARDEQSIQSLETRPVTIRMSSIDICFAQSVADYFRTTRSAFLQDLLRESLRDFFMQLSPELRKVLGEASDKAYRSDMKQVFEEAGGEFYMQGDSEYLYLSKSAETYAASTQEIKP